MKIASNTKLRPKILIVDDNKELGKNLSDILELKDYEVRAVCDGFEAIEAVKNEEFNVIVMDIKMPKLNGIDTLKIIRKFSPKPNIILITAFADDRFFKEELKNIEFEVIQKPIDIDKLLDLIESIC